MVKSLDIDPLSITDEFLAAFAWDGVMRSFKEDSSVPAYAKALLGQLSLEFVSFQGVISVFVLLMSRLVNEVFVLLHLPYPLIS